MSIYTANRRVCCVCVKRHVSPFHGGRVYGHVCVCVRARRRRRPRETNVVEDKADRQYAYHKKHSTPHENGTNITMFVYIYIYKSIHPYRIVIVLCVNNRRSRSRQHHRRARRLPPLTTSSLHTKSSDVYQTVYICM